MDRAKLHPLIVLTIDAIAREMKEPPEKLWAALEGRPSSRDFVERLVRMYYPGLREADFVIEPLTSQERRSTLHTMHTRTFEQAPKGRPSKLKRHPLMLALKREGITLAEEAKAVNRSISSLRSFCFPVDSLAFRPVPQELVDRWKAKPYKVPTETWKRVAD